MRTPSNLVYSIGIPSTSLINSTPLRLQLPNDILNHQLVCYNQLTKEYNTFLRDIVLNELSL